MISILMLIATTAFCKFKIIRPPSLMQEIGSEIKYSVANFGIIPWGHRLMGTIDMAFPEDACSPITSPWGSQFVLIKRGECTFVTKVRNAEQAGYKFAIIGDNQYETNDGFTMVDDGTGFSVSIPSIFISQKDFELLGKQVSRTAVEEPNDNKVFALMKFDVNKSDNVSVIIALNVQDQESYRIVEEFREYYPKLKDSSINFTIIYPLYSIYNTTDEKLTNNSALKPDSMPNCLAVGRYCSYDPDGAGVANGRNVVEEILRQTCIFKLFPEQWFKYMDEFRVECTLPQNYDGCSYKTQDKVQISKDKVKSCFADSFKDPMTDKTTTNLTAAYNPILDNQMRLMTSAGIQGLPAIVVNAQLFQGEMTGKGLFGEICNSYNKPPATCSQEIEGYLPIQEEEQGYIWVAIIFLAVLFFVFVLVLFYLYKKLIRSDVDRETQPQVNEMVSNYIKFYEGKDKQKLNPV